MIKSNFKGTIKLADFGWAVYAPRTKRTTFCGTLDYLSPEMAGSQSYNHKSDNWAIGVLAFEFLTGNTPFEKPTKNDTIKSIKSATLKFPKDLSSEAISFVKKLVRKKPDRRIELTRALEHPFLRD